MKPFLTKAEEESLVAAIREQETRTAGEIRVCLSNKFAWRHERLAWKMFDRLGMRKTRHRNAALIVMLPRVRRFMVLGDTGLSAVVPPGYWEEIAAAMSQCMREGRRLDALCEGIRRLGDTMASHWPRQEDDRNDLPDDILQD